MSTTCARYRSLFSGFLDGTLGARDAERVAAHLSGCAACGEVLAGLERVDQAVASLAAPAPPRGYLDELRARVAERVVIQEPGAGEGGEERSRREARRPLWQRLAPLAAAALVAVVVVKVTDLSPPGAVKSPRERIEPRNIASSPEDTTAESGGGAGLGEEARFESPLMPAEQRQPQRLPADGERNREQDERAAAPMLEKKAGKADAPAAGIAETPALAPPPPPAASPAEKAALRLSPEGRMEALSQVETWGGERLPEIPRIAPGDIDRVLARTGEAEPALRRARALVDLGDFTEARAKLDSLPDGYSFYALAAARFLRLLAEEGDGLDGDPELLRPWVARYAEFAEEWATTPAGQEASARSVTLALALFEATHAPDDCAAARLHTSAFSQRYPGDLRADSLGSLGAQLPCEMAVTPSGVKNRK